MSTFAAMTPPEYKQLKAFAAQDGALLGLLWTASFGCYVLGLSNASLALVGMLLLVATPFFAAWRLRLFRDGARQGVISFMRSWAFVILVFFYASVLFALAQYVYLQHLDHGTLAAGLRQMMELPENRALVEQMGVEADMQEAVRQIETARPIDTVLNIMTTNIMIGMATGLPLAALLARSKPRTNANKQQ